MIKIMAEASDIYGVLYQNLVDAGFCEKEITGCMDYAQKGEWKSMLPVLTRHKKTLLEQVHKSENMKRLLFALLITTMLFFPVSCGNGSGEPSETVSNGTSKTVALNSGYEMPLMGLGTYSLDYDTCISSVTTFLNNGGRLIDTAYMYHNEDAVGAAVRASDVPREEIFVTTKLYPNQYGDAANAIDDALEKMGLEYIDLMLLHHPGTDDVKAYHAMEQAVADGKIRSIGLSNWYIEELETFLPQVTIMPAVVQNEIHPYYQEIDVVPYIQELGIVVEGWYPFGGRGYTKELLGDETISAIADAHGVTSAQVILRWNLQRGVVVIPGSSNPDHIAENLDIFGFELTDDEMEQMKNLNRDEKHDWY